MRTWDRGRPVRIGTWEPRWREFAPPANRSAGPSSGAPTARGHPARIRRVVRRSGTGCAGLLARIRPSGRVLAPVAALTALLAAPVTAVAATAATTSPLADAAERLDTATLERLLAAPPAVDQVNAAQVDGMTALHWGVYHDRGDVVDRLLDAGADASAANRYGVVPLSLACANGNPEVVESLLAAGADPNAVLPGGRSVRRRRFS